jgi:hypothetical protein
MTQDATVRNEAKVKAAEDLAPLPITSTTTTLSSDVVSTVARSAKPAQGAVHLESAQRKKTAGERAFDLTTYGGVALLGNEAASLVITKSIEPEAIAGNSYRKFSSWFESLNRYINRDTGKPILSKYIVDKDASALGARLPFLLMATLGGMLMVPFVKALEDNKGSIVRKFDRLFHGNRADTDPELIAAHKEMDNAPKQSWSSLGWGRVTTVVSAAVADYAFGWRHALSTKLFGSEYASLDGIAKKTANYAEKRFNLTPKGKGWVDQGTWLLTLSATLTVLFYAASKLFARKRDEKIERKQERIQHPRHNDDFSPEEAAIDAAMTDVAEKRPQATVGAVTHLDTLARTPELAHGA